MEGKGIWLSVLRDEKTDTAEFRRASNQLARILCGEMLAVLSAGVKNIKTPVGMAVGALMPRDVMAVPILRAGLALMPAFTEALPHVLVGILGMERDEVTAEARVYYKKFPRELPHRAVILDPMLATGGSACMAVDILIGMGYARKRIYFMGVVAALYGFERLRKKIPLGNIVVGAIDDELNNRKYIVPGLGDYGDRYFGTV